MKRKILTLLLALAMVLTMLPMTALAAGGPVDLTGTATISSTQQAGTYYRVTGNTALTLNSAVIEPGDDANAPAIEVLSGKLTLTLVGESTVRGGRGHLCCPRRGACHHRQRQAECLWWQRQHRQQRLERRD